MLEQIGVSSLEHLMESLACIWELCNVKNVYLQYTRIILKCTVINTRKQYTLQEMRQSGIRFSHLLQACADRAAWHAKWTLPFISFIFIF